VTGCPGLTPVNTSAENKQDVVFKALHSFSVYAAILATAIYLIFLPAFAAVHAIESIP